VGISLYSRLSLGYREHRTALEMVCVLTCE
jgi:hypothetical protein